MSAPSLGRLAGGVAIVTRRAIAVMVRCGVACAWWFQPSPSRWRLAAAVLVELSARGPGPVGWLACAGVLNQLGRRNLHPDQASYLRGKRYNVEKQVVPNASGKNQHSEVGDQNDTQAKTADRLATEFKVSPATVKRDGQYAAAVDTLAAAGIEPHKIIAHETKAAVVEFANCCFLLAGLVWRLTLRAANREARATVHRHPLRGSALCRYGALPSHQFSHWVLAYI